MTEEKINLLNLNSDELKQLFATYGEKPYRAIQVLKWIYHHGVTDFEQMTTLSKKFREILHQKTEIKLPEAALTQPSSDGTVKWLLRLDCGNSIETVYIPEKKRGTLCISSQVGCTLNCTFCSTATQGFNRNLHTHEIIGQVLFAALELGIPKNRGHKIITNVVLMGMGEPLVNFDNVVRAVDLMLDDNAFGLSKRKVTISTSGLVPEIYKLEEVLDVSLAVSLHAPNDEIRNTLVPLNKKYPIAKLLPACKSYVHSGPQRKITFEYVMIKDINDLPKHAKELAQLLENIPSKINLIPFNPFPGTDYECSDAARIEQFRDILMQAGYAAIIRRTRGDDIDAACGQLVGRIDDRTRRNSQWKIRIGSSIKD